VTGDEGGQVAGKVVAITGAGRGIGAATARLLAARGAWVVLGSRGEDELAATADAIAASGGQVAYQRTDVTQPQDLRALVDLATRRFGHLDVLASIAGLAINAPLNSGELDDWNEMIDVNLRGVLHGIAAALPVFRAQGSGQFVTLASGSAYRWSMGEGVYAATKTAVRALCDVLRQEIAPTLRSTLIAPGFTNTDFISSTRDPELRAVLTARREQTAMPPRAVAEAIAYVIGQPDGVNVAELVVRPTAT
jgi:NADP-dependent 3-hydroxy acid dehydrogenase YdfG